jgi:hypothetical protein
MKKLLMKLFKIPDVNIALAKERKVTDAKIAKLNKKIKRLQLDVSNLKQINSRWVGKVKKIDMFLLDKTNAKKHFVQSGHDPKGKRCDICKGREMGILDYRKELLGVA